MSVFVPLNEVIDAQRLELVVAIELCKFQVFVLETCFPKPR